MPQYRVSKHYDIHVGNPTNKVIITAQNGPAPVA